MTQLTGVRRTALKIAIPLAIAWAGMAMSAQAASHHNGSDRSLKAAAEPPAKNLRPVTPDMLPGLLKKAPTGKSEAFPPRPEGIGAQAIPPGPYFVQSVHSFRCLDAVPNPPNTNGNKVHLWDCYGADWQKWYFWNLNSNNYLIANKYHGRILDADWNTICCNGTKIQIWQHIPGNLNQTWWLWTDGLGLYIQTNYPMPTPRLLDADLSTICCNGTKVQLWDPNLNNNQSWAGPPRP